MSFRVGFNLTWVFLTKKYNLMGHEVLLYSTYNIHVVDDTHFEKYNFHLLLHYFKV